MMGLRVQDAGEVRLYGECDSQAVFWMRALHIPTGIEVKHPSIAGTMRRQEIVDLLIAEIARSGKP